MIDRHRFKALLGITERIVYQNHADAMRSGSSYGNIDKYTL